MDARSQATDVPNHRPRCPIQYRPGGLGNRSNSDVRESNRLIPPPNVPIQRYPSEPSWINTMSSWLIDRMDHDEKRDIARRRTESNRASCQTTSDPDDLDERHRGDATRSLHRTAPFPTAGAPGRRQRIRPSERKPSLHVSASSCSICCRSYNLK